MPWMKELLDEQLERLDPDHRMEELKRENSKLKDLLARTLTDREYLLQVLKHDGSLPAR